MERDHREGAVELRQGKTSARLTQSFVGLPKLTVLPLKNLHILGRGGETSGRQGPRWAWNFGIQQGSHLRFDKVGNGTRPLPISDTLTTSPWP